MMKEHEHDLAFLDGGEGVYCVDADCDFKLTGDNLLFVLKNVCRVESPLEVEDLPFADDIVQAFEDYDDHLANESSS